MKIRKPAALMSPVASKNKVADNRIDIMTSANIVSSHGEEKTINQGTSLLDTIATAQKSHAGLNANKLSDIAFKLKTKVVPES